MAKKDFPKSGTPNNTAQVAEEAKIARLRELRFARDAELAVLAAAEKEAAAAIKKKEIAAKSAKPGGKRVAARQPESVAP
jgi:hypothetical protein